MNTLSSYTFLKECDPYATFYRSCKYHYYRAHLCKTEHKLNYRSPIGSQILTTQLYILCFLWNAENNVVVHQSDTSLPRIDPMQAMGIPVLILRKRLDLPAVHGLFLTLLSAHGYVRMNGCRK